MDRKPRRGLIGIHFLYFTKYKNVSITIGHIAALLGSKMKCQVIGDPEIVITGVASAHEAKAGELTFARSARFAREFKAGKASGALFASRIPIELVTELGENSVRSPGEGRALIVVDDVDLAMIDVLLAFMPKHEQPPAGIHPRAYVEAGAKVDPAAIVGPNCTVFAGAIIGAGVHLIANVTVGMGAIIGAKTVLHPGVVVGDRCEIGKMCIVHGGTVIGADGFGYIKSPDGKGLLKIPHIGNVVIGDDVEIGSNTSIDRGKTGSTKVGSGTKIDNLVQIGHNCVIGRSCVICGTAGMAGSGTLGDGVMMGGGAAIGNDIVVGSGAMIAALAAVSSDVPPGETYMGHPAGPAREWRRVFAFFRRLGKNRGSLKGLNAQGTVE